MKTVEKPMPGKARGRLEQAYRVAEEQEVADIVKVRIAQAYLDIGGELSNLKEDDN